MPIQVVIVPIIKGSGAAILLYITNDPVVHLHYHIHTYISQCHRPSVRPSVCFVGEENDKVSAYVQSIASSLRARKIRVRVDDRPNMRYPCALSMSLS